MSHSHMVIYQTSDGEPGSRQFDEIMAAVAFVEELRNRSGVDVARIFKLEEVKFEFKPYYQVLVVEGDDAASADEVAAPQEAAAPAATEEAAPVAAEVAADAAPAAEPVVEAVVGSPGFQKGQHPRGEERQHAVRHHGECRRQKAPQRQLRRSTRQRHLRSSLSQPRPSWPKRHPKR